MRRANEAVVRERYHVPVLDEVLQILNQIKVFTKLDIKWAYHQIELEANSREITTFMTQQGMYWYKRLKFLTTPVGWLVTPIDRPKSVRNRCVIEVLVAFVCRPLVFEFCVGKGGFVIGLGQISFFFSLYQHLFPAAVSSVLTRLPASGCCKCHYSSHSSSAFVVWWIPLCYGILCSQLLDL